MKHFNGLVDFCRLVDKNRLSPVEYVTVRFVAKNRRNVCDQPGHFGKRAYKLLTT